MDSEKFVGNLVLEGDYVGLWEVMGGEAGDINVTTDQEKSSLKSAVMSLVASGRLALFRSKWPPVVFERIDRSAALEKLRFTDIWRWPTHETADLYWIYLDE